MMAILRIGIIGMVFLLLTLTLLPLQLLAIACNWPLMRRLPRWWHLLMCRIIGLQVRVRGAPAADRPLLLVANHASWKDIMVLGSAADVVFIAKSEVRQWPVFGWLARLQRSVFVAREQKRTTGHQISDVSTRLAAGEIVVLFAEGTTSDGNRVLPFKSSLFGAATAAIARAPGGCVHIQPVTIAYTGIHGMPIGRYHRPIAAWPGDVALGPHLLAVLREGALEVDVIFGEPVVFDAASDRKRTSRAMESEIRSTLARALRGRLHP
ncbi:lyso-ornithine lipid acyltransferase [Hoeflea marina]|uniref:Lyso-ornithine lipid acyltransferase n=1 Tax=Hoeflea marina TaxID=274592 RepID=A0A317PI94_9HYPH|nr:lysophospholipid acyltransferase family protein [Hoeflea marina]PWW00173.1 lyso-ornithine lipid acyltransferase [Hoeflea marina]